MAKKFFSDYYWAIFNQSPKDFSKVYADQGLIESLFDPSNFLEQIDTPEPMLFWIEDLFRYQRNISIYRRGANLSSLTNTPETVEAESKDLLYCVEDGKLTFRDGITETSATCQPLTVYDLQRKFLELIEKDRHTRFFFLVDDPKLVPEDFDGQRIHLGSFLALPLAPTNPLCVLAHRKTTNPNFAIAYPPYDTAIARTNIPALRDLNFDWIIFMTDSKPEFIDVLKEGLPNVAQWTGNPDTNQFPTSIQFEIEKPASQP